MKRTATIRELLDRVAWGDVDQAPALAALYSGCKPLPVLATPSTLAELAETDPAALVYGTQKLPNKAGRFIALQPWHAGRAWQTAASNEKGAAHALRWGAGVRTDRHVGALVAAGVEMDGEALEAQASHLDAIEQGTGLRFALVGKSGDTRPESIRAAGAHRDRIEAGKSLQAFFALYAVDPSDAAGVAAWRQVTRALVVLCRGDVRCVDLARLFREPSVRAASDGRVRLQTTLRAEPVAYDVADVAERLADLADDWGVDLEGGWNALQWADQAATAAKAAERKGHAELAAELRQGAADATATLQIPIGGEQLLGKGREVGRATGERGGEVLRGVGEHYGRGTLPRDVPVRARRDGREETRPFTAWRDVMRPGERLRAWAPTEAGEHHTSGDKAGTSRAQTSGVLHCDEQGRLSLACHVGQVVWFPERPRDPALHPVRLPDEGESPYLDELDLAAHPVWILSADTGTGKTHSLARCVAGLRRDGYAVLVVSPRVSLCCAVADTFQIRLYSDESGEAEIWGGDGFVVCVNSLAKRIAEVPGSKVALVIEESEQVVSALFGGTIAPISKDRGDSAPEIITTLQNIAEFADVVVCADAFAGDRTGVLCHVLRPDDKPRYVHKGRRRPPPTRWWCRTKEAQPGDATSAKGTMLRATLAAVRDGKRAAIACTTKDTATACAEQVKALGKRVLLYTGDSPAEHRAELADVGKAWSRERCDVVIYSPVIASGLSYDPKDPAERFDLVTMFAERVNGIGWGDQIQMLDRVRKPGEVWVWSPERADGAEPVWVPTMPQVANEIRQRGRDASVAAAAGHGLVAVAYRPVQDDPVFKLKVVNEYVQRMRSADPKTDMIAYMRSRGAVVEEYFVGTNEGANAAKAHGNVKRELREAWAEQVNQAEPLTAEEYATVERFGTDDIDARAAFEKTRTLDRFGECSAELAEKDRHGGVWRKAQTFTRAALVANGWTKAATERERAAVDARSRAAAPRRGLLAELAALTLVRKAIGDRATAALFAVLDVPAPQGQGAPSLREPLPVVADPLAELADVQWSADTLDGAALAREVVAELRALGVSRTAARAVGAHPTQIRKDPVRALGRVLASWGIRTASARCAVTGADGKRLREYAIRVDELEQWGARVDRAMRRKTGRAVLPVFGHVSLVDRWFTASTPNAQSPIKTPEVWTPPPAPP